MKQARAHTRHRDPATSKRAAAKHQPDTIGLVQAGVLLVMKLEGRPLLDEEMIMAYNTRRKGLFLPNQSDQGLRTRRSELAKMDPPRVVAGDRRKMKTGGTGLTWSPAEAES